MSELAIIQDKVRRLAVLEERMNTHQAKYETALEHLTGGTQGAFEHLRVNMANWKAEISNRDTEAAKREPRIILAMFGMIAVATTLISFLIRLPTRIPDSRSPGTGGVAPTDRGSRMP